MKARVKATGEIVEVKEEYDLREAFVQVFYSNEEDPYEVYEKEELDFNVNDNVDPTIDYWEKLKHQYAGMAMLGMLSNEYTHKLYLDNKNYPNCVLNDSIKIAIALVEKLKGE